MNTKRALKWGLLAAATCVAAAAVPGCELLVDFDRSKIPSEGGAEDVTTPPDGPMETGPGETGTETSTDAPSEASEASTGDAPEEMTGDAPEETTTTEAGDAPSEAAPEGGMEAGPEGGDASDGAMGAASFAITPASVAYGTVATGETTAAYVLTVTNSGTAADTPTINKGGTNPGDFTATGCTSAVQPSMSCNLSVTFSPPNGATGARGATISVGTGTPASLAGTAATAGTLTLAPATQDFGSITNGSSSAEFAFTVTNTDAVNAVTLGTPTVDGQSSGFFVVDADAGTGQCTGTLAASGTCTLFLHFAPSGLPGAPYFASLSIAGTATDGGTAPGTASASLTGKAN
jgi:hypothetical protein